MPRRPRLVAADVPLHIIQRGNNRQNCFFSSSDYLVYLDMLMTASTKNECRIHAYVLMSNHIHLLISPAHEKAAAEMMKSLGERYVQYVNRNYNRMGTLWEGRYKSCPVQDEQYLLICHKYIELNPVRAGMVMHPSLYKWSSYRCNAHGETNSMITPHPIYTALGLDPDVRTFAYRTLFQDSLADKDLASIRDATNYNYVLGNLQFAECMAVALGRQVARVSQTRRFDQHRA
jgi:putative transposase